MSLVTNRHRITRNNYLTGNQGLQLYQLTHKDIKKMSRIKQEYWDTIEALPEPEDKGGPDA